MQNRRLSISLVLLASAALGAGEARADDKQACSDAYEKTQSLRQERKLQEAHEQALLCMRDTCAEFIRTDCATWLAQLDASQPTVVFEVRDAKGADVVEARVALDGRPWLAAVDVDSHPIDPGKHVLRFTLPDGTTVDKTVVIREGDKNVKVAVVLGSPETPPPVAPAPMPTPNSSPPDSENRETSVAPWVIGGVGVASLAVGSILGIVVLGEKSTFDDNCDESNNCNQDGDAARDSGQTLGPISTVALVLGGIGVGVAAVWLITDSGSDEPATAATIGTGPVVTPGGAGWRLGGSF